MNTRRIAVTLGAAGGGMLAAAFLSSGLAYADTLGDAAAAPAPAPAPTFSFTPVGPEQITSINGMPPFDQQSSGYQLLDINNTTTGTPVVIGTAQTLENSTLYEGGFTNAESLLTSVTPDPGVTVLPTNAVDGAIVDTLSYSPLPSLFTNVYTEIPGATATATPTVSDTLTLFGITFPSFNPGFFASGGFANPDQAFGPFLTAPDIAADLTSPAAVTFAEGIASDLGLTVTPAEVTTALGDLAALF